MKKIEQWDVPWVVLTFAARQYPFVKDSKYPSLVTYSNTYIQSYDSEQKRGVIVRDPINHERYYVPENERDPTYITLIGSPPDVKGHSIFIELARRFPEQQFLLVTHAEEYKNQQLPENIRLQDYIKDINELKREIYAKIKVLLLPSDHEAFGRVVLEATASDIPCVISNYPGLSEATFGLSNYVDDFRKPDPWELALRNVLENYDQEVERAKRVHAKLDYKRDVNHFRALVLDAINRYS
jgi:glycosyltransferase involved in cell wall biosynthesis